MDSSPRLHISRPALPGRPDKPDIPQHLKNIIDAIETAVVFGQGAAANRPVSTPGSPGLQGRIYVSTDLAPMTVDYDYGTGWTPVGTIADRSIAAVKLMLDTITAAEIAPNAIGNSEMADNSVGTAEIIDSSVTFAELAAALKPSQGAGAAAEALRSLGLAAGQAAAGTHALQHGWNGADKLDMVFFRKVTAKDLRNTNTEQDLLNGEGSIPAGIMGVNRTARFRVRGQYEHSTMADPDRTLRVRVRIGGAATGIIIGDVTLTLPRNDFRRALDIEFDVTNLGATNSNFAAGMAKVGSTTGADPVEKDFTTDGPVSIDTTTGKQVEILVTNNLLHSGLGPILYSARGELL